MIGSRVKLLEVLQSRIRNKNMKNSTFIEHKNCWFSNIQHDVV